MILLKKEKKRNENLKMLQNMPSKHGGAFSIDTLKQRQQYQGLVLSFQPVHLYVRRSRFLMASCTPHINDSVENENFFVTDRSSQTCSRMYMFCERAGPRKRMCTNFSLSTSDYEIGSVRCVRKRLLSFV